MTIWKTTTHKEELKKSEAAEKEAKTIEELEILLDKLQKDEKIFYLDEKLIKESMDLLSRQLYTRNYDPQSTGISLALEISQRFLQSLENQLLSNQIDKSSSSARSILRHIVEVCRSSQDVDLNLSLKEFYKKIFSSDEEESIQVLVHLCCAISTSSEELLEYYTNNAAKISKKNKFDFYQGFVRSYNRFWHKAGSNELGDLINLLCNELEGYYKTVMEKGFQTNVANAVLCDRYRRIEYLEEGVLNEEDNLRYLIKVNLEVLKVLLSNDESDYDRPTQIVMKYIQTVQDHYVKNQVLLFLYTNEEYSPFYKLLGQALDSGLMEELAEYLHSYQRTNDTFGPAERGGLDRQESPLVTCFKIYDYDASGRRYCLRISEEVNHDGFLALTTSVLSYTEQFGGAMRFLTKFPNIFLLLLKSLDESILNRRYFHPNTIWRKVLSNLIHVGLEDEQVLAQLMSPNFNLLYLVLQSLGDYCGFLSTVITGWCASDAMTNSRYNDKASSFYYAGIWKVVEKYGLENCLKCVDYFPAPIYEFGTNEEFPLYDFLQTFPKEERNVLEPLFVKCGVRTRTPTASQFWQRKWEAFGPSYYLFACIYIPCCWPCICRRKCGEAYHYYSYWGECYVDCSDCGIQNAYSSCC